MLINHIYYHLKPFIPRGLQIAVRRELVKRQRRAAEDIWPIDEHSKKRPDGWHGWPENKKFAFVIMHDVDTEGGHGKCRHLMQVDKDRGFRSSFNFVPERYAVSPALRKELEEQGFEIGVHGLKHDGKLFLSRRVWEQNAIRINRYLKEWDSVGFVSPSMHRKLDWMHDVHIEYDASTFDTDPFEPQSDGLMTIYPFWVPGLDGQEGYVELPYTLSQDFTLFVLMKEQSIGIWKKKLDWIAENGGMALFITHPDYINFGESKCKVDEYPVQYYREMLDYVKSKYAGQYWNALPRAVARFWRSTGIGSGKRRT